MYITMYAPSHGKKLEIKVQKFNYFIITFKTEEFTKFDFQLVTLDEVIDFRDKLTEMINKEESNLINVDVNGSINQ